jgi:hypothetical protein
MVFALTGDNKAVETPGKTACHIADVNEFLDFAIAFSLDFAHFEGNE